jgi:hypothetical protein
MTGGGTSPGIFTTNITRKRHCNASFSYLNVYSAKALFAHSSIAPDRIASDRKKIRLIEGNAKCLHIKKLTSNGTLRQVFICLRPRPHIPPYTLYTCIQYTYSHREGGGRVKPERRLWEQQFTKLGRKYQHD